MGGPRGARGSLGTWGRFRDVLLLAVSCGIVAGLFEGVAFNLLRTRPGWLTWQQLTKDVSLSFVWGAPVLNLLLFTVVGCLLTPSLLVLGRLWRFGKPSLQTAAFFCYAWLGFYAGISTFGRIAEWGVWGLATGLAFQSALWFDRHQDGVLAVVRRSMIPLAMVIGLLAFGTSTVRRALEERQLQELPQARSGAPNVLLIVMDTVRSDHLSLYGYARPTSPSLERLAREGVVFENAVAASNWTPPSHAAIFTGRPVHEVGGDNPRPRLSAKYPTLGEVAIERGYATAGFCANTLWLTRNVGLSRGFVHFDNDLASVRGILARSAYGKVIHENLMRKFGYRDALYRRNARDVSEAFLGWLDSHPERPFFAFLNYFDAHSPYISPQPFHTQFMSARQRDTEATNEMFPPTGETASAEERDLWVAAYDGAISYLDSELGSLLSALRERGVLDKTLVIITADHGEAFSEHGLNQHGNTLYRELLWVPLIMRLPGKVPAGKRIAVPVALVDVAPTIDSLALGGAKPAFPGGSLGFLWAAGNPPSGTGTVLSEVFSRQGLARRSPVSRGWMKSLVEGHWHAIWHQDGQVELYDWLHDPEESKDLSQTPEGRSIAERMVEKIRVQVTDRLSGAEKGKGVVAEGKLP